MIGNIYIWGIFIFGVLISSLILCACLIEIWRLIEIWLIRTPIAVLHKDTATFNAIKKQLPPKDAAWIKSLLPYGQPSSKFEDVVIGRIAYVTSFNLAKGIPSWVAWLITPEHQKIHLPRKNEFATDQYQPSVIPEDYADSGYDRGHLADDDDMNWDEEVQAECFYMTNMSPQVPAINRGTWKSIEMLTRIWVTRTNHPHLVYAGNISSNTSKKIGSHYVTVPDKLFKIIIDTVTNKSYAFIVPNDKDFDLPSSEFQVTVADVELASGLQFPVPDSKNIKNPLPVMRFLNDV